MKVRRLARIKQSDGSIEKEVVWFGSYGTNADGTAKFFNPNNKHDNFAEKQEYVADALTQKLSVLQKELWWNVSYGLPLMEKLNSKTALDATIAQIISVQPEVRDIVVFESTMMLHKYSAHIEVDTIYGPVSLNF